MTLLRESNIMPKTLVAHRQFPANIELQRFCLPIAVVNRQNIFNQKYSLEVSMITFEGRSRSKSSNLRGTTEVLPQLNHGMVMG
jgi:hypothetical protein